MSSHVSIRERHVAWFLEASEKFKREQLMFLHWSLYSPNEMVCKVACISHLWKSQRTYTTFSLCTLRYNDLKM